MTDAANKVLADALKLEDAERAKIAAELLSSLEQADEQVHEAWAREIESRLSEARSSDADEEDWRVVLDDIRAEILSR